MTQFGSNVLLLTRLVVILGSILEENVWPGIPGQGKKQDGGAWKEQEIDQGLFLANYSQYVSYDFKREAKKINTLRHCLPQDIWMAETTLERLFAKPVTPEQ